MGFVSSEGLSIRRTTRLYAPSLFIAVQEQLGLKLGAETIATPVMVAGICGTTDVVPCYKAENEESGRVRRIVGEKQISLRGMIGKNGKCKDQSHGLAQLLVPRSEKRDPGHPACRSARFVTHPKPLCRGERARSKISQKLRDQILVLM